MNASIEPPTLEQWADLVAERDARGAGEQKAIEYSIKLQRLIENLKYETDPPYPQLHHHKMIVAAKKFKSALNGMIGLVQLLSRNEDIPAEIRSRMIENHRFKDAQLCFPETKWEEYGLMAPDGDCTVCGGLGFRACAPEGLVWK